MAVGARRYVLRIGDHTLGTISDLAVSSVGDGTATLTWTPPPNATSQQPQRRLTGSGTWTDIGSALAGNVGTVQPTGLVNGSSYDFQIVATDGTNLTYSNTPSGTPSGGGGGGAPTPPGVGDASIQHDNRAGSSYSLQQAGVTDLASAKSLGHLSTLDGGSSGNTYPLDFVTDYDGSGTKAFRFNWTYLGGYTGDPSGCNNQTGQEDKQVAHSIYGAGTGGLYIQWKDWYGRTASGGGYGNSVIGSFDHHSGAGGHKILIIYRCSTGCNDWRTYFGFNGSNGLIWSIAGGWGDEGVTGIKHEVAQGLTPHDLNDYNNMVVTWTLYIKPESGVATYDGIYGCWLNDEQIMYNTGIQTGPTGFYGHQFGGPTWICPPEDCTGYKYDFVMWEA